MNDGGGGSGGGIAQTGQFGLSLYPRELTVGKGSTGDVLVVVQRTGEGGNLTFALGSTPTGVSASFDPPSTTAGSTRMSIAVTTSAAVGPTSLEVLASGPTGTSSITLPFTVKPPNSVLLVDDDISANNADVTQMTSSTSDNLFSGLFGGGSAVHVYVVPYLSSFPYYLDGPSFATIKDYQLIVWYCGRRIGYEDSLHAADESVLRAFLDQGDRKVIIVAGRYPGDISPQPTWTSVSGTWVTSYLGLRGIAPNLDPSLNFDVTGAGVLAGVAMTHAANVPIPSNIQGLNPAAGTDVLLSARFNPDGSGVTNVPLAIGRKNVGLLGTSKVIVVSFSFENLTDLAAPNTKAAIFDRLLAY
jgi:hypothetical protein